MIKNVVHYVADPMCSWCYGFRANLAKFVPVLHHQFDGVVRYRLAGLAPDSDVPMPPATQEYIQEQWSAVAAKTGAVFNSTFWTECQPRRSTYNACRAVIAARAMATTAEVSMFEAIQNAYYQQARNPSDVGVLVDLAGEIGLDTLLFSEALRSPSTEATLREDIAFRQSLGNPYFPSLILETSSDDGKYVILSNGFATCEEIVGHLRERLS